MATSRPFPTSFNTYRVLTWPPTRTDRFRAVLTAAIATIALWWQRGCSRRALTVLGDHELRDIGVTRTEAQLEASKPFWQA